MCFSACFAVSIGYGNSDYKLTQLIQYLDKSAYVQTNDQWLSLTDQLRLGVRMVELDTHYIFVCNRPLAGSTRHHSHCLFALLRSA